MFYKFLTFVKIFLYSEASFFIKKNTANIYFVKAKNGMNAEINITDRTMFVKAWSDVDYVAFYYCTPMQSSEQSFDQFVIDNIKSSIVFTLPTKQLNSYVGMHSQFFARFSTSRFPVLFLGGNISSKNLKDDEYTYYFNKLDGVRYPIVYFTKKKVIKNVFRYNLKAIRKSDKSRVQKVAYTVDNSLFHLADIDSFYSSKTTSTGDPRLNSWLMNFNTSDFYKSSAKTIGLDNQLFEHNKIVSKHLNLEKVLLIKTENKEFCFFEKNKRQLVLSYITQDEEKKNILTTYTYNKGKVKKKNKRTISDEVKNHELSISNMVMDNIETLKLKNPSDTIIQLLHTLDISTTLPLNQDDLLVLDMHNI